MDAFLRKCAAGGEVRVGFIGGSITEGALAGTLRNRYSSRFCGFLGKRFPKARFKEINAGIGATDSRYGCSRANADLLDEAPDLIVLEYAVNDDPRDSAYATSTMEGLIRKCLAATYAPILLFQTMNRNGDSLNHRYQTHLADHYGLPVISYRDGVFPEIAAGSLRADAVFADAVHPNALGHLTCAYLLFAGMSAAIADWGPHPDRARPIVPVPAPYASDFYERSGLFEAGDSTIRLVQSAGWTRSTDALGREVFSSDAAGSLLVFECPAGEMVFGFPIGKELNAAIEATVDGQSAGNFSNAYPEDPGGGYTRFVLAYRNPDSHAVRTVRIRMVSGGSFKIAALLYGGK
jgi:lysophospholipase L1-like esterase